MKTDRQLLKEANDLIRSLNSVIERRGQETNWDVLELTTKKILEEQHKVIYDTIFSDDNRPKTLFLDIDGTLIEHTENISNQFLYTPKLLKGTLEKLAEWDRKGYNIILTTGRKESGRKVTEKQLAKLGIFYDQLIMGIGGGIRVLINDRKKDKTFNTAIAINLNRNTGISSIENL